MIFHWILHIIGADNLSGPWYGFWSGFGSDIGEVTLIAAILRPLNCHEKGCWRLGHHVNGTVACHKHRGEV